MKNILVPIDFSECSIFALEYASALANIFDSNVFIFHNIATKKPFWSSSISEKIIFHEKQEIKSQIEAELKEVTAKYSNERENVKSFYAEGDLIDNINEAIHTYDIDFIVMGSHGASGKKEFFIGSNTQKVVRAIDCSIFVVKNSIENFQIAKTVFASNFKPSDEEPLKYALEFLKPFMPEIHLVEINTPSLITMPHYIEQEVINDFKKMCAGFKCYTHFIKDYSVDSGIRNFTKQIGADLIILSNNKNNPIKHFLRGSNVEFMVNHADVPVLSIYTPKKDNSTS